MTANKPAIMLYRAPTFSFLLASHGGISYACVQVHIRACVGMHAYACMHLCMHECMYSCMHVSMFLRSYTIPLHFKITFH